MAELKAALITRLKAHVKQPNVAVNVTEMRSQPVSVLGCVNTPGIQQLQGDKTLLEAISVAGGIRADAGGSVKITRDLAWGRIPLPSAKDDETGRYSVAELKLKSIMDAKNPRENFLVRPNDVITVARAQMVYVIGEVNKTGGFVLNERENVSVLQALSLAGGLNHAAAPGNARILRGGPNSPQRTEIPVNLKRILASKGPDVPLEPEDILFVPNSVSKSAALRVLETGISVGTGLVIWRR